MEIDKVISGLKAVDLKEESYQEIRHLIGGIGEAAYMGVNYHKNKIMMRARPNELNDKFTRTSDLSFKPQDFNKTYQRASTPFETMFYGSALSDKIERGELDNARVIGLLETMPWLRDKSSSGYAKITYGKWVVQEDLNLLAIIHHQDFQASNSYTRELTKAYEAFLKSIDKELADKSLKINTFLSNEFAKQVKTHHDYMISAIFTEIVVNNPNRNIDGILYPSVRVHGDGYNIALKPSACKKISLMTAGECSIYNLLGETIVDVDSIVELDGNTDEFEMVEIDNKRDSILRELGVNSIDELM